MNHVLSQTELQLDINATYIYYYTILGMTYRMRVRKGIGP
jgi:hypothetical protein